VVVVVLELILRTALVVAAVVAARLVAFLMVAITELVVFMVVVAAELVVDFPDHKPVVLALSVSFIPAILVHSHQQIQAIFN
jgi:hypothetical protein